MTCVRVPDIPVLVHLVCQHAGMPELCHVTCWSPPSLLSSCPDVICNFLFCPQFLSFRHPAIALAIDLVIGPNDPAKLTPNIW